MQCYTVLYKDQFLNFAFLAKPYQTNRHNEHIALVNSIEGYELDTPTTNVHLWHVPNHGPAHYHNYNHEHSPW